MQIQKVYVGGWFQRTRLHLSEIYDFLKDADSPLPLDKQKLSDLRRKLFIAQVEIKIDYLEYIHIATESGIVVHIYEDGLIVLHTDHSQDLSNDIASLTSYYEEKLSPAFSYLFSLGAPVPKELANIKTVYPYFITMYGAAADDIANLFTEFEQENYYTVHQDDFSIYRGDKLYLINQNGVTDDATERFIEEQIFVREFRGQLHRYLNLHRTIWERIAEVSERGDMQGKDIPAFKNKIEEYSKTIDFIDTRISQMSTYLQTRAKIYSEDTRLRSFDGVLGYKHETLSNMLEYMKDIWVLTKRYVASALQVFSDLVAKSTSNSVKNLTVVTSMGVGATLIGLFTTDKIPEFTSFGIIYFLILAGLGYSVNRLLNWYAQRKQYSIKNVELAKDL